MSAGPLGSGDSEALDCRQLVALASGSLSAHWEGRASGASEAGVQNYEVLGFTIAFLASNWDFLGFPIIVLGFPRIS